MDNYVESLLDAIDAQPELLDQLIQSGEAAPTRAGGASSGVDDFVRQILGNAQVSDEQVQQLKSQLADNPVVALYEGADGAIDAKELLGYVGGLTGKKANQNDPAVRALFDGRIDLKEILMIIMILKLFRKKQQSSYSNYYGNTGLFGSLFGNQQQSYSGGLFSNLLGGNSYSNSYSSNPFGMFGSLFGIQQPQQPSGLGALFGGNSYNSSYGNNSIMNILSQFVGGGYNQYPQANSLYNIFSNASQNAFNQSGSLNVSSLFSLLNTLMRG